MPLNDALDTACRLFFGQAKPASPAGSYAEFYCLCCFAREDAIERLLAPGSDLHDAMLAAGIGSRRDMRQIFLYALYFFQKHNAISSF